MKSDNIKFVLTAIITLCLSSLLNAMASGTLFDSNEVSYDNSHSGINSSNVQGAVDNLYAAATDYNGVIQRLSDLEAYFYGQTNYKSTSRFYGHDLRIAENDTTTNNDAYVDFYRNGINRAGVGVSSTTGNLTLIAKDTNSSFGKGNLDVSAVLTTFNGFITSKNDYATNSLISDCNQATTPGILYHTESGLSNCPADRWLFVWTKALGNSGTKNLMQFAAPINTKSNIIWARSSDMNGNFGSWQQIYPEVYSSGTADINTTNTRTFSSSGVSWRRSGNIVVVSFYDVCPKVDGHSNTILAKGVPKAAATETSMILQNGQSQNASYRVGISAGDTQLKWWWTPGSTSCPSSSGQLVYVTNE